MKDGSKVTAKPNITPGPYVVFTIYKNGTSTNLPYCGGKFDMSVGAISGNYGLMWDADAYVINIDASNNQTNYTRYGHMFVKTGGTISGNYLYSDPTKPANTIRFIGGTYVALDDETTYALPGN
jgi:hypothetical protein